jgi:uncharacterized protein YcfJ
MMRKIQAAVLGVALLAPAAGAFGNTVYYRHHHRTYVTYRHRHHYSETRGTVVGAAAGALIDHKNPVTGAIVGGVLGNVVQKARNHHHY